MKLFYHLGKYYLLIGHAFRRPEKWAVFRREFVKEVDAIGVDSLGIITIISIFMGAVITIQTASNIDSGLIPAYTIGYATRQSVILEFSPTIIALILAGKVGSNIASEIGTMRVTEQIDALEIMGVNSASFLIMPKIFAALIMNPFLVMISMFLGIGGGWFAGMATELVPSEQFIYGMQFDFDSFGVTYALVKTVVFAFVITSVSAYFGYYTRGGALEVGKASTRAVVMSSIIILLLNYLLTQFLLI